MSSGLPTKLFLITATTAFLSMFGEEPARVVVDTVADLQACVNRPVGPPLVCALSAAATPYTITGAALTIRRPNTTIEGISDAAGDPPTLKRGDPALKKLIWVQRMASNVTIRNLQIDGNTLIVPENGIQDLSVDGSFVTVSGNYFGDSASLTLFFGGPHFSLHHNTFGKLITGGVTRAVPGMRPGRSGILGWGPNATQFSIESNDISGYNGAVCINDAPGGMDPAVAGVISHNTLYHNATCVPNCGGGQIYVSGKTSNVKITNNTIDGGWSESAENRETLHSYGIEIDGASYIYTGSNQVFNNSISGMWIGNGAHHITVENDTVYNNGLNGVQIASGGRLAPVSSVSIIGLTSHHNDQHRSPRAPYPTLPRFWGVMIQTGGASRDVCIESDSNLATNSRGAVYSDAIYSRPASCPRPYN